MTRNEFVALIVANHNKKAWINQTSVVEGHCIGVPAYEKWVQVLRCGKTSGSTNKCIKTVRDFRAEVERLVDSLLARASEFERV